MGKIDIRLSVSTQLSSFTTISNPGAFNHYASSAYEPNWLKSIVKFSFQKGIFGEVHLGDWYPPNHGEKCFLNIYWCSKKVAP